MKLQRAFFVVVALVFVASFASAVSGATQIRNQAAVGSATSPVVNKLVLINADTDQQIGELTPGYVINTSVIGTTHLNIEAKTDPAVVGSVGFKLDALAVRTENTPPYAYAGDNGQGNYNSFTMTPGSHSLTVTAYTLSNRTGTAGPAYNINFTVTDGTATVTQSTPATNTSAPVPMAVTSFVIVNSDTNQDIATIEDGSIISLDQLGTDKITLRAETTNPLPGSVKFKMNGANYSTENLWPFTIPAGVSSDDYRPWSYNLDQDYEITATPYTNSGGSGTAGAPLTTHFKIILSSANAGLTGGSHAMVSTIPAMGCLNATVTNSANSIDSANPGSITVSWPAVSGYPNYKVWRILNGNVYDTVENTGTAYTTNYVTPGTWSIRVAFLDPAAALNSNGNWGPESTITGLVVGLGLPTGSYTTCTPTLGLTSSISLSAPSTNSNIISNSNFTVTAIGAPTSDQISSVKFYYVNEVGTNVLLGTDSSGPTFSLTNANLAGDRGAVCPAIYAEATLLSGSRIKSARKYIIVTDTTATTPMATCPSGGEAPVEVSITSPSQGGTYNSGQSFNVSADIIGTAPSKVVFYHMGGNIAQNIAAGLPPYTVTLIGTKTSAPYTLPYTVTTPGYNGGTQSTDTIRVIAYYPNGTAKIGALPFKVLPAVSQPQVSSLSLVQSNGTVVSTMTPSMSVNVGTQPNANTPLGQNISIKANIAGSPLPAPASVKFTMSGPAGFTPYTYTDNTAPFSLFGDSGSTFTPWNQPIVLGGYTVTATPYIQSGATGTAGTATTLTFQIVNLDDATPPTVPSAVTTTYRSSSEIRLSWTASSDPQTGVSYYKITRNPGTTTTLGNVTSYTDTSGLTAGGNYSYTVTAVNTVGQESGSSTASVPPALSTSFAIGNNVQTTASVTVKTAPDGGSLTPAQATGALGSIDQQYPIYYSNATYWHVNFVTGQDGWVNQNTLQLQPTADTQAPNQVTGLTVSNPTTSSLYIDWSATTDNGGGSVASYQVWRSTTQNGTYAQVSGSPVTASQTDFTDNGLSSTSTYWYKILAVDNATPSANVTPISSATAVSGTTSGAVVTTCTPPNIKQLTTFTGGVNRSVQISSSYSTSPASITICWHNTDAIRSITSNVIVERREPDNASPVWTTLTSTLPSTQRSYQDTTVSSGVMYEYRVTFNQTSHPSMYSDVNYSDTPNNAISTGTNEQAIGYISTGINVPTPQYNGKIILVIDNTFQTSLASSIATLTNDLEGDRWKVVGPIYVNRTDAPTTVRAQILSQYNLDTANTKAVYLIGHVPVAAMGPFSPTIDYHSYTGFVSDMIYADMNETWTSGCSSFTWPPAPAFQGTIDDLPSANKFCKTSATPELQVGRIDMYQMPAFGGTELSLLQGYLDRMHQLKTRAFIPNERAYISTDAGMDSISIGNALETRGAWNDVTSVVGGTGTASSNPSITHRNSVSPALETIITPANNYEFVFNLSQGQNCSYTSDTNSTNIAAGTGWGGVFNDVGISYIGQWNCQNNVLRALLSKGRGANAFLAINRYMYWHHMGMGKNIGYSFLKTGAGNNATTPVYPPVGGIFTDSMTTYSGNGYMTLLGDPTTRMTYVDMPGVLNVTGTSGNPATFTWGAASGSPDGYNIYKIGSSISRVNPSTISGTSYTGSEVFTSGTKYMVTAVKKKNSLGGGSYWNESLGSIYTTSGAGGGDTLAPSAPTNLAVTGTTATTASLSWTASTGNPVGESITYKILRSTATNGTYTQVGTATGTTYSDTGLTTGATYYYRVTASDIANNVSAPAPSATTGVSAVTVDNVAPTAPAGLVSTSQTTSSIVLSWNASTGTPAGETINYKVFRSSSVNGTYSQVGSSTTNTTFTDSGLTAGVMYYYKVSATDAAGNASAPNPSTGYGISTLAPTDNQPPTIPTAFTVTGTTASTVSLSWTASTDVGGSAVQGYIIYRSATSGGTYSPVGNTGGTTYTDSGLAASTTYYYKVSAIDNSSNGNESAPTAYVAGTTAASSGGSSGQVLGVMGYAGPSTTEDVTPGANPYGVPDYFIDCAAGSDTNNGTSASTPWKTIAKFNNSGSGSLQPGSRVFFKRGTPSPVCRGIGDSADGWGTIWINPSGTTARPIEFKAYGSGSAPVISGAITPTNTWTLDSGSIYKTNIGANRPVKYLFVGNQAQTLARTPNKVNGNTTWLYTDDQNGQSGGYYLIDSAIPSPSTNNLVGATVIKRYSNFNYDEGTVWSHSGTRLDITSYGSQCYIEHCSNSIYPAAGWGYIVQNDKELLDAEGEWYYNSSTGDLYFRAPGSVNPNTLTVDIVVDKHAFVVGDGKHDIKFKNLIFEKYGKEAIDLADDSGNSQVLANIILENNEIRNSFVGVKNNTNTTDESKANSFLNNYIHDVYNVGIWTAGYGHVYQGNVLENIGMDVILGSDNTQWAYFGIRNILGKTNLIGNTLRNVGYIGISNTGAGEVRSNLIDNASAKLNDGCGMCVDKGTSGLIVRENIIRNSFGNIENVPSSFIHASAITSGISTGDTSNVGSVIRKNVVMDFGNTGIALDNNYASRDIVVDGNTVYTNLPGNETGAAGLKFMDQSVGVIDAGTGTYPCNSANYGCFVANFNHQIYNNDVYMLNPANHTMYFYNGLSNAAGQNVDYGSFYGNYLFKASGRDSITEKRPIGFRNGDLAEVASAANGSNQTLTVYSSAAATGANGTHTTGDNGFISNRTLGAGGNYFWQVDFATGADGWIQEYALRLAPKTIAEWQTYASEPPSGQATNKDSGYSVTNQADMPVIYVNDTGSPMTFSPGSGWCDKNKTAVSSIQLNAFADVKVLQKCALMP